MNKFTAWVAGIWMFLAVLYAAIRPDGAGEAPSLRELEQAPAIEKPVEDDGEPAIGVPPGDGESGGGSEDAGESGEK